HYSTIILGAGISGLAAASRLFEHPQYRKQNQLLLLEARDRIGGRIDAVHVNGHRIDTGANWIHGVGTDDEPNPLMKILPHKKFKQLSGTVAFRPPEDASESSDDDWVDVSATRPLEEKHDLVIPAQIAGTLTEALWSVIGSLGGTASQTPADKAKQTSMLHAITQSKEFQKAFRDLPKDYHRTLGAMPQFIEAMEAAPLVAQSAEHSKGRAGFSLLEFAIDDFDGDQVFLRDGYIAIVKEVARHLAETDIIKTEVAVKQIFWDENPIRIVTSHGVYTANEVICSLPLGVLQHDQHAASSQSADTSLFQPSLPDDKQESIRSLGFGTLDKVFLVYDNAWWTKEPYTSIVAKGLVQRPFGADKDAPCSANSTITASPDSFMGFTDELAGIEIHHDGSTSSGVRSISMINLQNLTGVPALSAFVSCANATQVEAMTDEQASGILHRALSSWFGREPPKPTGVHVTRWALDEHSRGSYSHMITGLSETRHRENFQIPALSDSGSILRFAGEHTSRNHFATVHGALLSGWREADAIL
ncbi:hypothetical protein DOTSEDRAFT_102080, partial [Dothistroma septosporum NZE10]